MSEAKRFRRREKVVTTVDLPGVPAGTPGKIRTEAGYTWYRYFVSFENGVELSSVDAGALRRPGDPVDPAA
ncbi:MAG: hypothetical protein AAGA99_22985 [Actinomycetota bacterium]